MCVGRYSRHWTHLRVSTVFVGFSFWLIPISPVKPTKASNWNSRFLLFVCFLSWADSVFSFGLPTTMRQIKALLCFSEALCLPSYLIAQCRWRNWHMHPGTIGTSESLLDTSIFSEILDLQVGLLDIPTPKLKTLPLHHCEIPETLMACLLFAVIFQHADKPK